MVCSLSCTWTKSWGMLVDVQCNGSWQRTCSFCSTSCFNAVASDSLVSCPAVGGVGALREFLRAAPFPRAEETRGEAAARAVAPRAMDALVGELSVFLRPLGGVGRGTGADMAISCADGGGFEFGAAPRRPLSRRIMSSAFRLPPDDDNRRPSWPQAV